jgi:hypothetical protein
VLKEEDCPVVEAAESVVDHGLDVVGEGGGHGGEDLVEEVGVPRKEVGGVSAGDGVMVGVGCEACIGDRARCGGAP